MSSHTASRRSSLNPNAPEFVVPSSDQSNNQSIKQSNSPSTLEKLLTPQSTHQSINPYAPTFQPYSGIAYNYYTKPYLSVNQSMNQMSLSQPIPQYVDQSNQSINPSINSLPIHPPKTVPSKNRRLMDSRSMPGSPNISYSRSISRSTNQSNTQSNSPSLSNSPNQSPMTQKQSPPGQSVNQPRYYQRRASYDQSAINRYMASINQSGNQPQRSRYTKGFLISVNQSINLSPDVYSQCEWYQSMKQSIKQSMIQLPGVIKSDIELIEEDNDKALLTQSDHQSINQSILSTDLPTLIHV